jgi:hypothetical protein
MPKTYTIKANRTPQDVLNDNDITLETGYTLAEARIASIQFQKTGEYCAVWIEEEETKTPRVVRKIERDARGNKHVATYCDFWAI